ncbi:hypothetical protein HMPREF0083_00460 [Aneurinibacillus aneurinilyticus ATCC 12856]|jgi:hypothetical protein|uniref:YtkA-like domain-containing protein n=2 Tax=Aneurinibacillus aneurinilyticus TaxID=1391 RepID=U1XA93_ANEAE|nr:hypothetical protein HMPREF0083_00460 [Aneurinibacillus aneurinilyticus ATCC 12856]
MKDSMERRRDMQRKKRRYVFFVAFLLMFVGACAAQGDKAPAVMPLEIELTIKPETIHIGEKATIEAMVIQGKKEVADANEAVFEISKHNEKNHEEVVASAKGNGVYAIEKTFSEKGTYTIKARITAGDLTAVTSQNIKVKEK